MRSAMILTPASTSSFETLFRRRTTPSNHPSTSDCLTATSAPRVRLWPMPPVAAILKPATLRSLTSHIGSLHDDRLAASESSSTSVFRFAADVDADPREADAHPRRNRHRGPRIAAQLGVKRWRQRRLNLAQYA